MYTYIHIHIYIYIYITCYIVFGRGDDTAGNPRRARIYRFEPFELDL